MLQVVNVLSLRGEASSDDVAISGHEIATLHSVTLAMTQERWRLKLFGINGKLDLRR